MIQINNGGKPYLPKVGCLGGLATVGFFWSSVRFYLVWDFTLCNVHAACYMQVTHYLWAYSNSSLLYENLPIFACFFFVLLVTLLILFIFI